MRTFDSRRELLAASLAPDASLTIALRWAVDHAALAPSELNSQPWLFRAKLNHLSQEGRIELLLDQSRLLPSVDPAAREAVFACGAALANLRLALQGAALATTTRLCPDPGRPELLADVTVRGQVVEPEQDRLLRLSIPTRATHRGPFEAIPVSQAVITQLSAEAAVEATPVVFLTEPERRALDSLNQQATSRLWQEPAFRSEVADWSRTNASNRPDGVPGAAHGLGTWQSWVEPGRLRSGSSEMPLTEEQRQALEDRGVLAIVGAASESRDALLRAGAGMQRLLLRATSLGLAASYRNAALHVPDLRSALGRAVRLDHPQVVLRIGYAEPGPPTPRRPASTILKFDQ